METVFLERLLEMAGIDRDYLFRWEYSGNISIKDICKALDRGIKGTNIPYGDDWKYRPKKWVGRGYHIRRIIYFVSHPEEIADIEVCNPCMNFGILPEALIVDGWHRIAAAIAMRKETVYIDYGGREDVLDYMAGKCDLPPNDVL